MTDCHEIFRFPGIHSRDGQLAMRMREGYLSEKFGAFIALYPTYVGYFGYLHWCASPKIYAWSSLIHSLEIKVFWDNNSYYDHILMLFLLAGSRLHQSFVGPKPALDQELVWEIVVFYVCSQVAKMEKVCGSEYLMVHADV